MRVKKVIFLIMGCICLGMGVVGIIVPLLPAFPFFMGTLFFFAKSSERMCAWFMGTNMYKKHLYPFLKRKGMTVRTKVNVIVSMTVMMVFGFIMMSRVPAGRIILIAVWACHIIYFIFRVKTINEKELSDETNNDP